MLLIDWIAVERREDRRAYLVISSHLREAPDAGKLFPLLRAVASTEDEEDPDRDLTCFHAVNASLTPYTE